MDAPANSVSNGECVVRRGDHLPRIVRLEDFDLLRRLATHPPSENPRGRPRARLTQIAPGRERARKGVEGKPKGQIFPEVPGLGRAEASRGK